MKLAVILTVTSVFVDVCFGNKIGHTINNYYGLHSQRGLVSAEGNKIAVYKVKFPHSVSRTISILSIEKKFNNFKFLTGAKRIETN